MIIISDCSKNIVIPAGLGDNPGVVYETAGVKSLNGETGDLKIKTVNGNDMLGEGNVAIDTGVESLNGQKGALTLKTVNGNELTGDGNIEIKAGVESVNGETGNVIVKSLKYFDLATDNSKEAYEEIANHWDDQKGYTGDFIFRYKKGQSDFTFDEIGYLKGHSVFFSYLNNVGAYDLTGDIKCFAIIIWYEDGKCSLSTYENNYTFPKKVSQLTNDSGYQTKAEVDTAIENAVSGGSTGSDNVIVLDNLSQEERKAIHDKLDLTKPLVKPFMYEGKISVCAWDSGGGNVKFLTFGNNYDGIQVKRYNFAPDGWLGEDNRGHTYTNSVLFSLGTHVEESGYFDADYIGNFYDYIVRPYTRPNAAFINLEKGIGDSTQPIYAPVSVSVPTLGEARNVRIQFIANEKLYTFIIDAEQENRWHFESAEPITGGGATNALTYKQITNENRQEVYDDVKAHWSDVSGYTGNYVYFYQKDKDQIIFDEVKFENNIAFFNSAAINYTSGQVHNPLIRLLCCIVRAEGNVELAENNRVISDINGMRYICGGVINDGDSISFRTNSYGDGYDIYNSTNTGGRDGMFDAQFENGIDGYKGNTPANIFTDGTDVFMAFDVVDFHYVYKVQTDGTWAFVSKTKIGGVQSSEVSNIKVLSQAEYDGLTAKDENVLYCIKG